MSDRILWVETKNGRPALSEDGFGYCCETLTMVDGVDDERHNWHPYVPAHHADQLKLERDEARRSEIELRLERCENSTGFLTDQTARRRLADQIWGPGTGEDLFPGDRDHD